MSFPYNNPATDFRERIHMNNIINLLNLEDKNIEISKIVRDDTAKIKYIYVHTNVSKRFCPICDMRMHSRGTRQRTVNHPMLQDGYELIILLKQRRWRCTNPACGLEMNEGFNFVNPRRRFSNASDFLILEAFKDLSKSARAIAKAFKSSDSHVLNVFDKYVKMERLPPAQRNYSSVFLRHSHLGAASGKVFNIRYAQSLSRICKQVFSQCSQRR